MNAPHKINGNRLRWWNRLRWRAGMVPFRACPNGEHMVREIYGDEIHAAGGNRTRCEACQTMWPTLNGPTVEADDD